MRDLINLVQILSEAPTLAPNEFKDRPERWQTFINKIIRQEPFTTTDDQEVTIDPVEAARLKRLWDAGQFIGNRQAAKVRLKEPYNDQMEIQLSRLKKTTEFGGAGVAVGADPASGGKASYALSPQGIGIVDKDIPATDLYETIKNNPVLNKTDHGKLVIQLADYIVSGESVSVPPEVDKNTHLKAAIQDNAGEYLGVLALLYHRTRFPARERFEQWLGGRTDDLIIRFPSQSNYALADSFAVIKNPKTRHSVNISSKGKGGGAAPAISGLKIPDNLAGDKKLATAIQFVKICQEKGTIEQAFDGMDLLYKTNPKSIDPVWHKFLPFSRNPRVKQSIIDSLAGKKERFDKDWKPILASVASERATDGGKIVYAIKREVADAVNNKNAIPEFKALVLEILEMNFVQQYTDYGKRHKYEFTFETQWPAKLEGLVSLENKSSAKDPTTGGFSFKLGRTDTGPEDVGGEPGYEPTEPEDIEPEPSAKRAGVTKAFQKSKGQEVGDEPEIPANVGRRRRR